MKTKIKLTPPDRKRCQGFVKEGCHPDAESFMVIGPLRFVRCDAKPVVVVTERKKAADGLRGSMSLCEACLTRLIQLRGAKFFTSKPI